MEVPGLMFFFLTPTFYVYSEVECGVREISDECANYPSGKNGNSPVKDICMEYEREKKTKYSQHFGCVGQVDLKLCVSNG